jgi:hypothetical protein
VDDGPGKVLLRNAAVRPVVSIQANARKQYDKIFVDILQQNR